MASTVPYYLVLVGLVLTASLAVLGKGDDVCFIETTCQKCVVKRSSPLEAGNGTCIWEETSSGEKCVKDANPSQEVSMIVYKLEKCADIPTTVAPNTTTSSTTPSPATTNATTPVTPTTTPVPATTNSTTTTTTSPSTNGTTPITTPTPSNGTTPITTPTPSNGTTTTAPPKPTPAPTKGGFSWTSFIGGIVFAAALSSVAYLIWRFYKVRLDRNYHTFSNPTF